LISGHERCVRASDSEPDGTAFHTGRSRGRIRRTARLHRILGELPPDDDWAEDLRELRRFAGEAATADPWTD
jgi:hypothetical protein